MADACQRGAPCQSRKSGFSGEVKVYKVTVVGRRGAGAGSALSSGLRRRESFPVRGAVLRRASANGGHHRLLRTVSFLLFVACMLLPALGDDTAHASKPSALHAPLGQFSDDADDDTARGVGSEDSHDDGASSEDDDATDSDSDESGSDSAEGMSGSSIGDKLRRVLEPSNGELPPTAPSPATGPPCRPGMTSESIVKLLTNTPRSEAERFIMTVSDNLLSDTASSRVIFRYHMNELQAFSMVASECFMAALRSNPLVDFIEDNDVVPLIQSLVSEARATSHSFSSGPPHFVNKPPIPFYMFKLLGLGKKRKRRAARQADAASRRRKARQAGQTCIRDTNVQEPLARINFRRLSDARDRPIYQYEANAGQGVVAYVVDTGIFGDSLDFAPGNVERGVDATTSGGDPFVDTIGHGTHVAGIIGSQPYGVAKAVTLVAVKVFNNTNQTTDASVIAGLSFIFDDVVRRQQPAVINLSLGARGNRTHRILNMAVECLIKAGAVVVAAAGNNNEDACQSSPAVLSSVITVGNVDNSDRRHANSSFGPCVDIFAPGVDSASTGRLTGSFRLRNGTSVSAAFVSGVVARLLTICPAATPAQVKDFILKSSTKEALFNLRASPNRLLFVECTDQVRTCQDLGVVPAVPGNAPRWLWHSNQP